MASGNNALRFADFGALPKRMLAPIEADEDEVLLLPARKFHVKSCLDSGHGLHIVQVEEVTPEYDLLEPVPVPDPVVKPKNDIQGKSQCDDF
ncbi:unnamed protein product [Rotaria sp. Silwood1]|nr:unnamed protein product [Rotaria sp. Silwood1]CAF3813548.1 unnamed protein product [Rotaria sp. Silwood1]CAF3890297.1 unnamed protein product [Rotaria sp. Silwood1]CAF4883223.1 unnamed protein product [Rotaria sp. Silwood1]CAF4926549.1 unnamed protein product [Rotaria sp. Silwood1]